MNKQDFFNLQEAYLDVYDELDEENNTETPLQKIRRRNKEYFINTPENVQKTTQRRGERQSQRGVKKVRGAKSAFGTMRYVGGPYNEENEYNNLDEVVGGGRVDPMTGRYINRSPFPQDRPNRSRHGASAQLNMTPLERSKARSKALRSREDSAANKRANKIDKFVRGSEDSYVDSLRATQLARSQERKRWQDTKESYDVYDVVLSYLLDEGYADSEQSASVIMANMSEEWREFVIESGEGLYEAYVDWRKGSLSNGVSPRERAQRRAASAPAKVRLRGGTKQQEFKALDRSARINAVKDEMDRHTSLGGLINKILSPGLGNRGGASPRMAHGEPNTHRHQLARYRRTGKEYGQR